MKGACGAYDTLGEINCNLIGGQILDQFLCSLRSLIKLILQFPTEVQLKLRFTASNRNAFMVLNSASASRVDIILVQELIFASDTSKIRIDNTFPFF